MVATTNVILIKDVGPTPNPAGTGGVKQVTLHTTRVEQSMTKNLSSLTPASGTASYTSAGGTGPSTTIIIDLLRNEFRWAVDGWIQTDFGDGDTSSDADNKRLDLIRMFNAGGVITLTYNSGTFLINMDKITITQDPMDDVTADTFMVKFTAVQGINYG